ncbi:transcriptional regulator, HxlR family [Chitinophaga terrae (ex Kim and Jung 2007)]|jgi:DNA-binding HxlR family transcriptional regulator|uniref:Transcriptional regulator, HxlR family n=1 Tax=Chitinophaga terrae (ex Kim and Jung 2007) TaxID=408074 RepID=A0A1H4APB5_9BACT|nr:helix-turn-helix domain-containing protein [Chitinophaga terrae (ex Kim and Jung 2007)]GEP89230.1 MarR family transcriptional regulator [Chitinophaga terrae (ex Kim and Jung 2007)]SEA37534.1 transcriptional regulator, HxlR family [Chitinophaga terrae (ex Kim and Jung 2007)]
MRKETSSNAINRRQLRGDCGTAYTLSLIGGRWKASILWKLLDGRLRFNELKKSINGVSERVLALQLKELERDGLITRIVYPEVPPRVEYELTPLGLSMETMLRAISDWGVIHRQQPAALLPAITEN